MARVPGTYVPLDINYLRDPAIRKAGPDAELLYIRTLAFIKGAGTDGVLYEWDLSVVAVGLKFPEKRAAALVKNGLWEKVDDGWYVSAWVKWNMTQDELKEQREAKRAGAIKTNHNRKHAGEPDPTCPHCTDRYSDR